MGHIQNFPENFLNFFKLCMIFNFMNLFFTNLFGQKQLNFVNIYFITDFYDRKLSLQLSQIYYKNYLKVAEMKTNIKHKLFS